MIKKSLFLLTLVLIFTSCIKDDFETNGEKIQKYLDENNITDVQKLRGDVFIRFATDSTNGGTINEEEGKSVEIKYKLKDLETGAVLSDLGKNLNYDINNLVLGMQLGLEYMSRGDSAIFYIPSDLAWFDGNVIVEVKLLDFSTDALTDSEIIKNYFNIKDIKDTVAVDDGEGGDTLYIKHIEEGEGDVVGNNLETINVKYSAVDIVSGRILDYSNQPVTFTLENLYEGWKMAVPHMKKGGKAFFYIPSSLTDGYMNMFFEVELVDFTLKEPES